MDAPGNRCLQNVVHVVHFCVTFIIVCALSEFTKTAAEDFSDYLLCRKCGASVGTASDAIYFPSIKAVKSRNTTLAGVPNVLVQAFKNPQGDIFEVITLNTSGVIQEKKRYEDDTWFTGYSWSFCFCPSCGKQLGWSYFPMAEDIGDLPQYFYGFILDNLVAEQEAETLIHIPKAYRD